jgi:eukaryotic-like serine/threonine-protein kinase
MTEARNVLSSAAVGSPDPCLEQVLSEQVRDWLRGECQHVDVYLDRQPSLLGQAEAMLELINQEIVLRRRRGDAPRLEEYLTDFPDLAEPLSQLFDVHNAISLSTQFHATPAVPLVADRASEETTIGSAPRITGYQIERVLGSGGMGVVYLANDLALKRKVALKVLRHGAQDDPGHRGRFEREAAAAAKCQHPNLVQIFEIGEHLGEFYLALEYVEGGTLAKAIAGMPQPPREAATLVEKLARAIDHVHGRGVVHRDLKPANVLLTTEGEPKITDFGLARLDDSSTRTEVGTMLGTLAYMAPEQASSGSVEVGAAADIHAIGTILYESLTGRAPYRGDTAEKTLQKILFDEVVPPSNLQPETPRDLEAICLKCLEKAPNDRYATAVELAEDLRRYLDGRPTVARPVRFWERGWRWCRRNPKLATFSTSLVATVLIAVFAFIGLTFRHNIQLRAEVQRTEDKAAEAGRNAAESRRNYQEARSTIQAMLARANDQRVAGSPKLIDLRHDLQEDARGFYDRILAKIGTNDLVIKADTANACAEASFLEIQLGHPEQAEKLIRRALELIQSARAERPDEFEYLGIQVICLLRLTNLLIALGRADQALEAAKETVQKAELLAKATPDNLSRRELFATCLEIQGNTLYTLKRHADARVPYRKAIEIRENIDPDKLPGVTSRLAGSLMNEAVMFSNEQQIKAAEGLFGQAEKVLLAISPDERAATENLVSRLSQLYMNWGGMLCNAKRFDEALARVDDGLRRIEPYLRTEPNDAGARQTCLELHGNRGLALSGLGKHRESADEWKRVLELSREPVPSYLRIQLALELLYAGQLDQALKQAQLVQPAPGITDGDRYNLGCLFSLAAAAARKDASSSPGKGEIVVESHILESLRWLKSASEAGFFRDPANRDHAKNDTDLEILRDRPEFRQLIEPPAAEPTNKAK